ncbi:SigE family RNA polymerase sigma factor [Streptacidiphilus sp. N1-12]|uniref:SigE family RNA polymerase sigma factor n=2 Tax=Streptacidiphilus alkalitolerans TaxID=3342712 RepID=A0ABV6VCH5_9ACTN
MTTDDVAFTEFVAETHSQLTRSARLLTGDWHSAEDLVQATLMKVYRQWRRVVAADSALAYTQRIMLNLFLTSMRRRWHGESAQEELPEPAGAAPDFTGAVGSRDVLSRALRQLPRRQRAVVVLRYYEDLSVEQTAHLLDCSAATVRSQASRALAKLRSDAGTAQLTREA